MLCREMMKRKRRERGRGRGRQRSEDETRILKIIQGHVFDFNFKQSLTIMQ